MLELELYGDGFYKKGPQCKCEINENACFNVTSRRILMLNSRIVDILEGLVQVKLLMFRKRDSFK